MNPPCYRPTLPHQSATLSPVSLEAAYQQAVQALLRQREPGGFWVGELSASALSTATAVMALALIQKGRGHRQHQSLIQAGLAWLARNQNADGGFGDTVRSFSNISTTMLCRSAFYLTEAKEAFRETVDRLEHWLFSRYGSSPAKLAEAVRRRYGKDRTFAVPILTTCALAGLVEWREVPPLPFELACFPQSWFRFLKLHVVSYALPALIAIGQCVHHHRPSWNPFARLVRFLSRGPSLRVLEKIQPSTGGFLEATPLTSFVCLALAGSGLADHPVVEQGTRFLVESVRPDGSWPIDTNLSTWVTTLSVNALAVAGELADLPGKEEILDWLLAQQYHERHPYTGAAPGAWAWTPLAGGVPDADDTPGALLALIHLAPSPPAKITPALREGVRWLLDLQNSDGGWPTFCRGWGYLPFDRSGTDLTAHALRALQACEAFLPEYKARIENAIQQGLAFLARTQRPDGAWLPLWFGNQHAPDDENPTYGTCRVLAAYRDLHLWESDPARKARVWLQSNQNPDGGWGGGSGTPSSMEETALAVELLHDPRGLQWLIQQVEAGQLEQPKPIGFYFAKLWYFEKLYPILFTVAGLGKVRRDGGGIPSIDE